MIRGECKGTTEESRRVDLTFAERRGARGTLLSSFECAPDALENGLHVIAERG